jgi:two-component system response regulator DesR
VIRVLVAEDERLIRGALLALLGLEDDFEVVADVDRGDAVLPAALKARPDVAGLDIGLPGIDGLTVAAKLREELPDTHVPILTGLGQPGYLRRALEARVGGYMRKNAPSEELADAIRRVAKGQRFLDPDLVASALGCRRQPADRPRGRGAARRGRRRLDDRDRRHALPLAGHRPQLPLAGDR